MNTIVPDSNKKRSYLAPIIGEVKIDNTIALQLQSTPPDPGNESRLVPEYNQNCPLTKA